MMEKLVLITTRISVEATTKRYKSALKDIGTKISTDKGGKTERLRAEHIV